MNIFYASQSPSSVSLTTMVKLTDGSASSTQADGSESSSSTSTTSIQCEGSLGDGCRAIDRYNPIIRDSSRISKSLPPSPLRASLAASPKSPLDKSNTNSSTKAKPGTKKQSNLKPSDDKLKTKDVDEAIEDNTSQLAADSTRYLLTDPSASVYNNYFPSENMDPDLKFDPEEDDTYSSLAFKTDKNDPAAKSSPASRSSDQVVVLRVSLHCKGCERKMRKHLSKMQGVSSFSIDFAAKKVTVVGDVTPLQVIASISKVKNIAQISTPSASMLSSSSSPSPVPVS